MMTLKALLTEAMVQVKAHFASNPMPDSSTPHPSRQVKRAIARRMVKTRLATQRRDTRDLAKLALRRRKREKAQALRRPIRIAYI